MVKAIVDKPHDISLDIRESEDVLMYELSVGSENLGQVIGKKGKNINALRVILSAMVAKEGRDKRSILEVIE
jgi:predicted RNA-binding protein YlqC (UPF0109 family)